MLARLIDRAALYLARSKIASTEIIAFSLVGSVWPTRARGEHFLILQPKKAARRRNRPARLQECLSRFPRPRG
jgi:hypothetical protein